MTSISVIICSFIILSMNPIMLSGSTIDTFEAWAERATLNHTISVVSNLLGKDLYVSSNRPLPIHLHSHEISKFLDTET